MGVHLGRSAWPGAGGERELPGLLKNDIRCDKTNKQTKKNCKAREIRV